nr:CYTH domain-containing protein [Sphingosinicella soli]
MGREIERKFLVAGDGWRAGVVRSRAMAQAYIARGEHASVRVRIIDENSGRLTIKGRVSGLSRDEFEYEVPLEDARGLIALRSGRLLAKRRYDVMAGDRLWEVDVFEGELSGLVIAECELEREDEAVIRPDWLGREVTADPHYYNAALAVHGLPLAFAAARR